MARRNTKKAPVERHKAVADWSEAPTPPKDPRSLTVKVLVAGVYNGPRHKALPPAKVGDIITVAAGAYADSLIEDGFVAEPGVEPAEEE